jgi:hypothetical protein
MTEFGKESLILRKELQFNVKRGASLSDKTVYFIRLNDNWTRTGITELERFGVRVVHVRPDMQHPTRRIDLTIDFESKMLDFGFSSVCIFINEPITWKMKLIVERAGWTIVSHVAQDKPHLLLDVGKERDVSALATTKSYFFCAHMMKIPLSIETRIVAYDQSIHERFGNYIRDNIMAFCYTKGLTYVGLGDTLAQAKHAKYIGCSSVHVNNEVYKRKDILTVYTSKELPYVRDPKRIDPLAIALPAGSGKSTLAQKYGFKDIDDYREVIADELDVLVKSALATNDWTEHNDVWYTHVKKQYAANPVEVMLLHNEESARIILGDRVRVFTGKVDRETHERNIELRGDQHRQVSRTNWDNSDVPILGNNVQLEDAVINWVTNNIKHYVPISVFDVVPYGVRLYGDNEHHSQRKLMYADVSFMVYVISQGLTTKDVVVAGASPGNHFYALALMFPDHHFHLYDPVLKDVRVMANLSVYDEEFKGWTTNHLLISDIRTSVDGTITEKGILSDMQLQKTWAESRYCVRASLKFRLPYEFSGHVTYLSGDLILQPWSRPNSFELRLFTDGHRTEFYDVLDIRSRMQTFNRVLRPRVDYQLDRYLQYTLTSRQRSIYLRHFPQLEHDDDYLIADLSYYDNLPTLHHSKGGSDDIVEPLRRMVTADIETYPETVDGVAVALFSISNVYNANPVEAIRQMSSTHRSYVLLFPNSDIARFWKQNDYGINFNTVDGVSTLTGMFRGAAVADQGLSMYKDKFPIGAIPQMLVDFIGALRSVSRDDDELLRKLSPFEGNHRLCSAWIVVSNVISRHVADTTLQTIYGPSTGFVRWPSLAVRHSLRAPRYDITKPRYLAAKSYALMNGWDVTLHNDDAIATIHRPGNKIIIQVSGHMLNQLLCSTLGVTYYDHYLNNVRLNVHAVFTNGYARRLFKKQYKLGILSEYDDGANVLWHTYHDYYIAVLACFYACALWNFDVPIMTIHKTLRVINRLLEKYPQFDTNIIKRSPDNVRIRI